MNYQFISVLLVFLCTLPLTSVGDTQGLINQICRGTDNFNFCHDIFEKYLYTPNLDIKGLTQIAVTQSLTYCSNTRIFIQKAEASEPDKELRSLYKICEAGYGVVLGQLVSANLDFAKGDYKSMILNVHKCEKFINDCESGVGSRVAQLSQQNLQNRVLVQMSLISGQLIGS